MAVGKGIMQFRKPNSMPGRRSPFRVRGCGVGDFFAFFSRRHAPRKES